MDIDELLTKYFEGETTTEEEKRLRTLFASGQTPQQLDVYKPIFAYFDKEIKEKQQAKKAKTLFTRRKLCYLAGSIAATVLLLITIRQDFLSPGSQVPCLCSANYVVINGHCYTDMQQARSLALQALREVAASDDVPFPGINPFNNKE
jgi:hypothetical protein